MELTIKHDSEKFTANIDGQTAILKYSVAADGKTLDYYSTFVPPELRGQGIGESLARYALDYAKTNKLKIIPSCPFVRNFITKHPEYAVTIAID